MKKSTIKVIPQQKGDEEKAKLMEELINHEYKKYSGCIKAITLARNEIEGVYNIQTRNRIWDRILEEVIKLEIKDTYENKK